ncbi:MAG: hypothetical protein HC888_04705, partial [Candidatus Competibacteraceae bacterium]|nr:hypothetical protein [Candidatus Competibacteraceae bacterium]
MMNRRVLLFSRNAGLLVLIGMSALAGAANYDIPKVTGIIVDGALDDWGAAGLAVEVLTDKQGRSELPGDFDPRFRLSWDETGLALALTVVDDLLWEQPDPAALWDGDSFEWFILSGADAGALLHVAVSPGLADGQPELRSNVYGFRQMPYGRAVALELARVLTETGYQLEARVPWSALEAPPAPGGEIGVQLYLNDADHPPARFQATWFPQTRTHEHADHVHRLRLAEQASSAIRQRTQHGFDAFGRAAIDVTAIAEWS